MSQVILPIFTRLWNGDSNTRIEASAQLVGHLESSQKSAATEAANAATTDNEADGSQLEDGLAADVSYTLKRLIRGLASPRESSRIGFAVALTELLQRLPDILPRQVIPLLKSSSDLHIGTKGAEERDLLFARLFGIHAIVASGLLYRDSATLHDWRVAIEEALYLGEHKVWLRESAAWVVQGAVKELLRHSKIEWKDEGLQAVIAAVFKPSAGGSVHWTPERVALAVLLQHAGVSADWESLTKPTFATAQLLSSPANLPAISRILRGLSADEQPKKVNDQTNYFGTTQLHFVWTEILNAYFVTESSASQNEHKHKKAKLTNGEHSATSSLMPFNDFYIAAVEDNLVTDTSSIPSKYVGLMAFKACLSAADAATLPYLFTPNVLRTLMNHLSKGDRTLHGISIQISKLIPSIVQAHQAAGFDVLMAVYRGPVGNILFDSMTRTKTAEGVVAALDLDGIKKYTNWLTSYIIAGDSSDASADADMAEDEEEETEAKLKEVENRRAWAIDQLVLLVRKHAKALPLDTAASVTSIPEQQWIAKILQFLIVHGFTKVLKTTKKSDFEALRSKPEEPFSDSLQQIFRARFFSSLSHLINVNTKCRSEPWTKYSLDTLLALHKDTKHVTSLIDEERMEEISVSVKLLSQTSGIADKQKAQYLSLLLEILALLACDPTGDADAFLEQAQDAVEAILASGSAPSKASSSKQTAEDSDEGEEAEPVAVLVDLLVNLMQKSSVLLRTVSERVFAAASSDMSEQALQLLLDQITPEEFTEEEIDGDNASEADSDAENKGKQSDDDDSESSGDEDEDDDDLELEVDEELRAKILDALKDSGVNDEEEDEEDDNSEDEEDEELLDDDQMMELDDKLAEIFKSRKSASKSAKETEQATHDAQLKVLDLLEVYAKQQSSNPLLLSTILPLFNAARRSSKEDIDIAAKALRVLNGIVSKAKDYPTLNDASIGLDILRAVHQGAARTGTEEVETLAIATSLYLCKVVLSQSGESATTSVADIYASSLNSYLIKKSCRLHGRFFESFINRYKEAAWHLREPLLEGCSERTKTKDQHRRAACFHLLSSLLVGHAALKTPEANQDVVDFAPRYAKVFLDTFKAAAAGEGMKLQAIRLREIIKACSEAVRATKLALKGNTGTTAWDLWKSEELGRAFAALSQSKSIDRPGSLNSAIRHLMDQINQGSGKGKLRDVKKGEPGILKTTEDGKPLTKLEKRKQKKAALAERGSKNETSTGDKTASSKQKKRKAAEIEEKLVSNAENGASTSEDSD